MPGPPVMLASTIKDEAPEAVITRLQASGDWWFEIKFDGIRAVVHRTAQGEVTITNRNQVVITDRYPDVVKRLGYSDFVGTLDGEIICLDANGRPDFELAHLRDAQQSKGRIRALSVQIPATFVPFDVLEVGSKDVRAEAYTSRRMRLATVFVGASDVWSLSSLEGAAMWQVVVERNLEGLVAKLGTSTYSPGRSKNWVKVKATKRVSVLITGIVPGKGSRGAIGALNMALWDPASKSLIAIGNVGSGMSEAAMRDISARLEAGTPIVVEVEYLELSSAGQLRSPVFKGIRRDIAPQECLISTII